MNRLNKLRQRYSLFCIDSGQNLTIFGRNDNTDYRRLVTYLMPCQKNLTETKCNKTKEELLQYLDQIEIVIYYNSARFNYGKF